MVVVIMIRMNLFPGSGKASNEEEQGRKCHSNDSEERHSVGLEGSGHSAEADCISRILRRAPFSAPKNRIYSLYGRRAPSYQKKNTCGIHLIVPAASPKFAYRQASFLTPKIRMGLSR